MRDAYHEQLRDVLEKLTQMGGHVEAMLESAVEALVHRDPSLAADVLAKEDQVNALQNAIDEECVNITVRQQPVAGDARFMFVASRAATDVERVGDQAINILENTQYVLQQRSDAAIDVPPDIGAMAALVQRMLADALAALVTRDIDAAERVFTDEVRVDAYRDGIFRQLLRQMITDPLSAQQAMSLVLISRNLERVGDHATNIAEEVVYLVRGHEIRHKMNRARRRAG